MKWNVKDNKPIESGMTKEDVVHFVRMSMYKLQDKNKTGDDDDIEESEVDMGLEVEDGVDGDINVLFPVVDTDVPSTEEDGNEVNDDDYIDDDYMFPSFFAFMLYGPFASDADKLDIFREGKHYIAYN